MKILGYINRKIICTHGIDFSFLCIRLQGLESLCFHWSLLTRNLMKFLYWAESKEVQICH